MRDAANGCRERAPGVEITPEMIGAGADELFFYEPEHDDPALRASLVFEAMMRARDEQSPRSDQIP